MKQTNGRVDNTNINNYNGAKRCNKRLNTKQIRTVLDNINVKQINI